jgi:hypothetical protein
VAAIAAAVLVTASLGLAACGGDDEEPTTTEVAEPTEEPADVGAGDQATDDESPEPKAGQQDGDESDEGAKPLDPEEDEAIQEERVALIRELVDQIRGDRDPQRIQEIRKRLAELREAQGGPSLTPEQQERADEFLERLEQQREDGGGYFNGPPGGGSGD